MPEITPPLFGSWVDLGVILVALVSTWGAMIAMLRSIHTSIQELAKVMKEGFADAQDDHEKQMAAFLAERDAHTTDHRAIEIKLTEILAEIRLAIATLSRVKND